MYPQECLGLMGRSPADSDKHRSPYPERFFQKKSKVRTVEPRNIPPPLKKKQNYTVRGRVVLLSLLAIPPPEARLGMLQLLRRAQMVV